ncbi:two-component sensor histidine kinase [Natronosporangium hydrolyticum]|uniref:Sensor-like histidine kinase SenX3 n=1 Tax=Natronosporangium hydrolyticum TaxID=2811111 RepID=A0A895YEA9_9ACTN|nr:ATP-binding protein [Natronosporangium hydrolyticum]QSB14492.1 two-component sensor histidine kinase [Natronosporangium hydrolyticum]
MNWALVLSLAGGLLAGAGVTLLAIRRWGARLGPGGDGRMTIASQVSEVTDPHRDDPRGGLARKSVDSLRVGVVVLDAGDQPVLVNPSARAMGLLRAGAGPGTIAAHPVVRTLAAQVRRSGVRREVELDLPRTGADGAADPLGVVLRAVGLGADHVAVEAADATESHRVARVRRDFVANVGHELKTPIGALQLLSEALLDATQPGDEGRGSFATDPAEDVAAVRRFAERIQQESTRLGRLVSELLELSRVQGAEPLPDRDPVSVEWLTAEALDRARTGAAAKRIEVTVTGERGLTVYGSAGQLATALSNLVENAVAYSPEGSSVTVEVSCQDDGGQVVFAVVDHGIGIAAKELDRIFERFYRSDRARSRATGGTGLGLAIVKHIATNHGGRVEVNSTLGEGSTFTLRLPARPPEAVMAQPAPAEIDVVRGLSVSEMK